MNACIVEGREVCVEQVGRACAYGPAVCAKVVCRGLDMETVGLLCVGSWARCAEVYGGEDEGEEVCLHSNKCSCPLSSSATSCWLLPA